ncbi:hypothetical protein BDA99DRAFT_522021 [Phascolomyces articulosus]|uniref:Uncharacterized protein n=1 Tax=Phascolomyces articulosus TaxID=60185 RepID=A0AAD5P9R2_9FUNG|nr:hypothetical protein BDA99DRAFT_522021 [Phascolomyces articulosus]
MTSLNQWLQKHRRPKSAVYLPSTSPTPEKCENRRTMSWAQPLSQQQQYQQQQIQQQRENPSHYREHTSSVRTSLDCGFTIPVRNTSKHYQLDSELQAKVDRVVSSDKIRLLSQRVQRQRIQSMCSCPPGASDTMTTLPIMNIVSSPIQEEEYSDYHPQHQQQPKKQKRTSDHHQHYHYQQYHPIPNHRSSYTSPPPPPHHYS